MSAVRLAAPTLGLLTLLQSGAAVAKPGWQHVAHEDGITVSMREVPGRGFPTFRGRGIIYASMYQVLAVMSDFKRHTEWMERCIEARKLRKINEREYIVYARTDVPWPLSDRDAVYHSKVHIDLKRYVVDIRFWAERSKLMPPVDGVVRMTDLRGHYKMRAVARGKTHIEYQVDADPKGLLPTWLAKIATKRLPLQTIRKLRKQAQRTRGWYTKRIERWKAGKY
jgi:hypothetical protein